jgi:hypothetical protein
MLKLDIFDEKLYNAIKYPWGNPCGTAPHYDATRRTVMDFDTFLTMFPHFQIILEALMYIVSPAY